MKSLILAFMLQLLLLSNHSWAGDANPAQQSLANMDIQAVSHNGKLEITPIERNAENIDLDKKFQTAIADGLNYLSTYQTNMANQANKVITASFDPILQYFDDKYRDSSFKVFAAHSNEAALLYAMKGATENDKVLVISKTWAEAAYAKGFALFELGQLGEAKYYLTKALGLSPFNATYLFELGQVLLREKNWPEALANFKAASQWASLSEASLKPVLKAAADRSAGYALTEMGRLDEAEAIYRQVLTVNENDQKARAGLDYIQKIR